MFANLIPRLYSISTTIQKIRRQHNYDNEPNENNVKKNKSIAYSRAFVQLLNEHIESLSEINTLGSKTEETDKNVSTLRDALSRAPVQALRAAADFNDYKLIHQIIRVSSQFGALFSSIDENKLKDERCPVKVFPMRLSTPLFWQLGSLEKQFRLLQEQLLAIRSCTKFGKILSKPF